MLTHQGLLAFPILRDQVFKLKYIKKVCGRRNKRCLDDFFSPVLESRFPYQAFNEGLIKEPFEFLDTCIAIDIHQNIHEF